MPSGLSPMFWSVSVWFQWLTLAVLMALALWHDWRERRIPNRLLLAAVGMAVAMCLLPGGLGLASALGGALIGTAAFAPLYLLRQMGGGDLKLMATTGLLVGVQHMGALTLAVALCGGALALVWLWRVRRRTQPLRGAHARMPYAAAVAAGTLAHGLQVWHAAPYS